MTGSPKNTANPEHPLTPGKPGTGRAQPTPGSSEPFFYEIQQDPQLNALVEYLTPEQIMN